MKCTTARATSLKEFNTFDNYVDIFGEYCKTIFYNFNPLYIYCSRKNYTGVTDDKILTLEKDANRIKQKYEFILDIML